MNTNDVNGPAAKIPNNCVLLQLKVNSLMSNLYLGLKNASLWKINALCFINLRRFHFKYMKTLNSKLILMNKNITFLLSNIAYIVINQCSRP